MWMTQLGDAASPRRPGSEFEMIFTAWRNGSQIFKWNSIRSGPKVLCLGKERCRDFIWGEKLTRQQQHVCKRFEDLNPVVGATFSCRWRENGENLRSNQNVGHQEAQTAGGCWGNWGCSLQEREVWVSNVAADVPCRGGGCEWDSERLFSLVVERTASRNYPGLPLDVRVRRAGAVRQGCSLLGLFSFSLREVRRCLLVTPGSMSVQGTHAMRFPTTLHFYSGEKEMQKCSYRLSFHFNTSLTIRQELFDLMVLHCSPWKCQHLFCDAILCIEDTAVF